MWTLILLFALFIVFLPDLVFAPVMAVLWCLQQLFGLLSFLLGLCTHHRQHP